ncbi:hypothetical protein L5515_014835 [Caenorhabditis briggsae]|uniref:Ubiquitin-like protease family profile domain-containing protein n=1 Tax=Caenorhabditis briggsae TaxID=6238 RepID=A0AAE9IVS2_CAEBR|nr:hypothetical protein L3Y34_018721 [Caenorhabditis briggsae]UMM19049.1 hypothetical protein L5515_014835 [Caenorhabditis briggsae]
MEQADQNHLNKFKEFIRKQDASISLQFKPAQAFFGNHLTELDADGTVAIRINRKNKLYMRIKFAGDPVIGYKTADVGLSFGHIDQIKLVDEEKDRPPVIIFTLSPGGFEQLDNVLPGLKDAAESSLRGSKPTSRMMMLSLGLFNEKDDDSHLQIGFNDQGLEYSKCTDFDNAKIILKDYISPVMLQHFKEKVAKKKDVSTVVPMVFVQEIDNQEFDVFLQRQRIVYQQRTSLFSRMSTYQNWHISIPLNSEAYSKGSAVGIAVRKPNKQHIEDFEKVGKLVRKRKIDEGLEKNAHWLNREGWVRVSQPEKENHARPVGDHNDQHIDMKDAVGYTNGDNGAPLCFPAMFDRTMGISQEPVLQYSTNGFNQNPTNTVDVVQVTEKMSSLGYNFPNGDTTEYYQQNWVYPNYAANNNLLNNQEQTMGINEARVTSYDTNGRFYGVVISQGDNGVQSSSSSSRKSSSSPPVSTQLKKSTIDVRGMAGYKLCDYPLKPIDGIDPVEISIKDVKTLDRKEFVNDAILAFMQNYIYIHRMNDDLKKRTVMCNTFFYPRLVRDLPQLCYSQRRPINLENDAQLEENLLKLHRWFKRYDLFGKDYMVIPVNEDLHWLLIAVINPAGAIIDLANENESRNAPKTYMLFMDPMSGLDPTKCNHMSYCVKRLLKRMYDLYKAPEKKYASANPTMYDESRVIVVRPKNIPIQDNFFDCGMYVLHYIEGLFCSPTGPITVNQIPTLDWAEHWPEAEKMCDLMRDKVYNLLNKTIGSDNRSRLAQYEQICRCGLSREGALRNGRRHSAPHPRRTPRHLDFYRRCYSLNPPNKNIINDEPMFTTPRGIAIMPLTQRVRSLRKPEEGFPLAY